MERFNVLYQKLNEVQCVKESRISLSNLLFLCFFIACKHNEGCLEVYERIVNKGKSKKLALIAVSNKQIKHTFLFYQNK
jgi:hypothetical protein